MRNTPQTAMVLRVLLGSSSRELHGYEICQTTGLKNGTVGPILKRLADNGWLKRRQERGSITALGRPLRVYYKLTSKGIKEARALLGR